MLFQSTPPALPSPPVTATPALPSTGGDLVAVSGGFGTVQVFQQNSSGSLVAVSSAISPFSGYYGTLRSAIGDFNGDGTPDLAVTTAAGPTATVLIYNGKDFSQLVGPTVVLGGFTGGAFLAAGDINHDGDDELVVGADYGGGPRVTAFNYSSGSLSAMIDLFAFDAPTFAGGARVAAGDINHDGYADIVVTAGPGGGPRVSTYDGKSATNYQIAKLLPDFFAYDANLRTGAYVAAADLNQDGYAEIIFSADVGGSSRTIAYSGALMTANPNVNPMDLPMLYSQYAIPEYTVQGTRVTVKDLNGDGKNEMIFTTAERTDSTLRVITSDQILSGSQPTNSSQKPIGDAWDTTGLYVG